MKLTRIVMALLLATQAVLLALECLVNAPTLNEPAHLVAGVSNWHTGKFDLYRVNPPLVRMTAAAPVCLAGVQTDWKHVYDGPTARPEFLLGDDFLAANRDRWEGQFRLARCACIPFALLGGYICFRWARDLYGDAAGLTALALWCFCPNILGHGQLITSDIAATSLGICACYSYWKWLQAPTWGSAAVSGALLGAAELAKTTLLVFYPLWPAMWLIYRWPSRSQLRAQDWWREFAMIVMRMGIGLYVVNLGYGFEGTGLTLRDYLFVSEAFGGARHELEGSVEGNRFADSWLGNVPVLLPKNYVMGIDRQRRDFEHFKFPSYLRNTFRETGWWHFYLYALAIKVPLGTLALFGLSLTTRWWAKPCASWRDEFIVAFSALVMLGFVSSQTGISIHMRYILPLFPFAFIWISRVLQPPLWAPRLWRTIFTALLGCTISSSLWCFPHSLSYFNELVGGPRGGAWHLLHSNIDWGQDLFFLRKWLAEHPEVKPLHLAYFGYVDPNLAGIDFVTPVIPAGGLHDPAQIPPGWYAISVNFLWGFPHNAFRDDSQKIVFESQSLSAFRQLTPVATAGYSIYIYHVSGDDPPAD